MLDSHPTTAPVRQIPRAIVTVVPAHNERERLAACLAALRRAAGRVPVPVATIVVLDACSDGTEHAIPDAPGLAGPLHVVEVDFRNVGAARAAGFAASGRIGRDDVWFATTDADSVVPDEWYLEQLAHAAAHDVVAGTVRVDWTCHTAGTRSRYEARYRRRPDGRQHGHVHGANLGLRADLYGRIGGFAPLPVSEDVDLVTRAAAAGARIAWHDGNVVTTSDRRDPRARGGFGDHLHELARIGSAARPTLAAETR